jgi:hypothetical protein
MNRRPLSFGFRGKGIATDLHFELGITKKPVDLKLFFGDLLTADDLDRVVGLSNGRKGIYLSSDRLHIWFHGVRRAYEEQTGKRLEWLTVFTSVFDDLSPGPLVTYIQLYSGRQLYLDLVTHFQQQATYRGWNADFLSGDGTVKVCLENVRAARRNGRNILIGLPPAELGTELHAAVAEGLSVVATGCDTMEELLRVNTAEQEVGKLLAGHARREAPDAHIVAVCSEDHRYPQDQRLRGITEALGKEPEILRVSDQPRHEEVIDKILKRVSRRKSGAAVIGMSRGITQMLLNAFERQRWPARMRLLSTDLTQDWLSVFERRHQWLAAATVDVRLVMETACKILDIAMHTPSQLPTNSKEFPLPPLVITRAHLQGRTDWEYRKLIDAEVEKQRKNFRRTMDCLRPLVG